MGCDGGTIPKRDELVRTKKKKEELSKDVKNAAKWKHCHLSQEQLRKPIVVDLLGYLYNKEALLEYLLDRSKFESGPDYIKSLKDVKELNLTDNPSFSYDVSKQADDKSMFICPITGLEMNGVYRFFFLHSCGCVFSERAFKTISSSISNGSSSASAVAPEIKCIKCEKVYNDKIDLIVINPEEKDLEINREKLKLRKETTGKNAKKNVEKASEGAQATVTKDEEKKSKRKLEETVATKAEKNTPTPLSDHSKKIKPEASVPGAAAAAAGSSSKATTSSIQNDPTASEVFKSLFTSHEKAKNQTKAHWVTFNPQYF